MLNFCAAYVIMQVRSVSVSFAKIASFCGKFMWGKGICERITPMNILFVLSEQK